MKTKKIMHNLKRVHSLASYLSDAMNLFAKNRSNVLAGISDSTIGYYYCDYGDDAVTQN